MSKRLYWEDVKEGTNLPPLEKKPTTRQLVQYAGASGDFNEIHYDKDFARDTGLSGVILHGALKNAFLGQLVTDWMGDQGFLKKLTCQYRGMDIPGDTLLCKGTVKKKYTDNGEHRIECEIWIENGKGERTTKGSATIKLPIKQR